MTEERWSFVIDTVHDALLDCVEPCDNEEPITRQEFALVVSVLTNNIPFTIDEECLDE